MKREFNKLLLKSNIVSDSQLTKDEKVFEEDINLFNRWNSVSHTLQMVSQTNQSIHEIPDETVKKKKKKKIIKHYWKLQQRNARLPFHNANIFYLLLMKV